MEQYFLSVGTRGIQSSNSSVKIKQRRPIKSPEIWNLQKNIKERLDNFDDLLSAYKTDFYDFSYQMSFFINLDPRQTLMRDVFPYLNVILKNKPKTLQLRRILDFCELKKANHLNSSFINEFDYEIDLPEFNSNRKELHAKLEDEIEEF